jgi:hypothetical protein
VFDISSDGRGWKIPLGVRASISAALGDKRPVSIGLISGDSSAQAFWLRGFQGAGIESLADVPKNRTKQVDAALSCLDRTLRSARPYKSKSGKSGSDVMGALQEVGRKSTHTSKAGEVDFVSNGLANTENFSLQPFRKKRVNFETVRTRTNMSLPDLRGLKITFYYLGQVSDGGKKLQAEDIQWIHDFWVKTCYAGKAASCLASPESPAYR